MTTITRVQTDWINRIHVQADADASVLNCFMVELPPYTVGGGLLIHRAGASVEHLWTEALHTIDSLRLQPRTPAHPAVFIPFGVITARSVEDVRRESELTMLEVCESEHPEHMERVRALCRMADLLGMCGPMTPPQFGSFPPARH